MSQADKPNHTSKKAAGRPKEKQNRISDLERGHAHVRVRVLHEGAEHVERAGLGGAAERLDGELFAVGVELADTER